MRFNRFYLLLAALGLVWTGTASGRDVRNNKNVRSSARPMVVDVAPLDLETITATDADPTDRTDCARHCADNAEHVFKECMSLPDSPGEEECAARARAFLERCLKDQCDDVPDCVERCHAVAGEAFRICREAGGSEETCGGEARKAFEDCIAANCPPPPPPTCEEGCQRHAEGVYRECISLDSSPGEEECAARARHAFESCVQVNCNPEPNCEDRCKHAAREVFDRCMAEDVNPPHTEDFCALRAREFLGVCLREQCDIQPPCEEVCKHRAEEFYHTCVNNGVDPERCALEARDLLHECLENNCSRPPDCEEACRDGAEKKFHECMAEDVDPKNTEEECAHRARAFLEACLVDKCNHLPSCEERCRMAAADEFRDCMLGGGTIEACAADALATMNSCIANCGEPPTCEEACRARVAELVAHCIVETGDIAGCAEDGAAKLEECLTACPPP